jgi:hypothetical protein
VKNCNSERNCKVEWIGIVRNCWKDIDLVGNHRVEFVVAHIGFEWTDLECIVDCKTVVVRIGCSKLIVQRDFERMNCT